MRARSRECIIISYAHIIKQSQTTQTFIIIWVRHQIHIWVSASTRHEQQTLLITVHVASAASPSDPWHADTRRPGIVSRLTTQTHSSQTNRSKHTHASASIQQPEGVVVVHLHHPAADTARTQATHSLDHTPRPARPVCCSMQAKPASCRLLLAAIHTRKSS